MALGNIDLRKLRIFQLTARHGSLRRAASELLVTPAAVSIQLKNLEADLGVELFQRVGKRLILSPSGEQFLRDVDAALQGVDAAIAAVARKAPSPDRISIAIGNDLAGYFSDAVARFMKLHPAVEIALRIRTSPHTLAMVMDGEIDLGIGYFGAMPPEIAKTVIRRSGFSLLVHRKHPLAERRSADLSAIAEHRVITLPADSNMGRRITQAFVVAGVAPVSVIEAGNCHTARQFAEKGIGAAITHTACLAQRLPRSLRRFDLSRFLGQLDVAVIHRRSRHLSLAQQDLVAALRT